MRALTPPLVLLAAISSFCRAQAADEKLLPAEKPQQNAAASDNEALEAYRQGLAAARAGQHDAAIGHLNAALARIYLARGRVYLERGDHNKAIADFTAAIELNPDEAHAYLKRAAAYARMGDHASALQDFDEAIRQIARLPSFGQVPEELDKAMLMNERLHQMEFNHNLYRMQRKHSFDTEDLKIEFPMGPLLERPQPAPEKR